MPAMILALVMLAACAPFGEVGAPPPPSRAALATVTANASATFAATAQSANHTPLPSLQVDPGWEAVAQVTNSSTLGGPTVTGNPPGSATASAMMTLGSFRLSSAATVVVMFGCSSPASVHATVAISIDGDEVQIPCNVVTGPQRDQMQWTSADVGRKLTVTATITTDDVSPQWNALVEQPK